jgi:hypothetical protein
MSDMTNLYKVYASVHNSELKQEITESRDSVSEMNLSGMTDSDLVEISESIIENLFTTGYSEDVVHNAVSQVFETFYESVGSERRKEKLERLSESFNKAFNKVYSFAESNSTEAFINYRKGRVISEKWNNKVSHEHGNERLHAALISEESHLVKSVLTRMITDIAEGDKSYLEKDMKKRQANNEKARKELAKGPQMKNPAFEEVSTLRQGWGDAYSAIYEKKLDAVGKEDGDIDNDGDEDSSDSYLAKRRKAIGKSMGKKGDCKKCDEDPCECDVKKEEVEEYVDFLITEGYDCSDLTWDDMYEEYQSLDEGLRSAVKKFFGGGKKEEPAKPMSRGDQLRKKYNVGPERSDTSAKAQILKRTRARAERDQKEFGGSRYSKGVADRSKAAHQRQLKGGYSKYGADDARGKGNKARKRAASLTREEVTFSEAELKAFEEIVNSWED